MVTVDRGRLAGDVPDVETTGRQELTPAAAARLTATGGYPCISVLMPTTPALRLELASRERLDNMLREVERRLDDDGVPDRDRWMRELRRLARIAQDSGTSHAVGLFVGPGVSRVWTLPVTVHQKVVIESSFATRDLLRALHRTPPHLVVRVDELGARVFWVGARVTLLETVERLPVGTPWSVVSAVSGGSLDGPMAGRAADRVVEDRRDLLARVDACVTRVRAQRPGPLVLAGDPDLVAELRRSAQCLQRLAGEVVDARADTPDDLFAASALCVADYLHRRGQQTLYALRETAATTPDLVVAGLDACWAAVARPTPGILVVEQGYVHPRAEGPGAAASHDLIDDLLELALAAGNLIAFVEDAQLHEFGGVALLRTAP